MRVRSRSPPGRRSHCHTQWQQSSPCLRFSCMRRAPPVRPPTCWEDPSMSLRGGPKRRMRLRPSDLPAAGVPARDRSCRAGSARKRPGPGCRAASPGIGPTDMCLGPEACRAEAVAREAQNTAGIAGCLRRSHCCSLDGVRDSHDACRYGSKAHRYRTSASVPLGYCR